MPIFWQARPPRFNPWHQRARAAPTRRIPLELTDEDVNRLDRLAAQSGLAKRSRFLRWLLWTWDQVEERARGHGLGQAEPSWDGHELRLAILKRSIGLDGKARWIPRIVQMPDGWRHLRQDPEDSWSLADGDDPDGETRIPDRRPPRG